jgi:hypothetical protein
MPNIYKNIPLARAALSTQASLRSAINGAIEIGAAGHKEALVGLVLQVPYGSRGCRAIRATVKSNGGQWVRINTLGSGSNSGPIPMHWLLPHEKFTDSRLDWFRTQNMIQSIMVRQYQPWTWDGKSNHNLVLDIPWFSRHNITKKVRAKWNRVEQYWFLPRSLITQSRVDELNASEVIVGYQGQIGPVTPQPQSTSNTNTTLPFPTSGQQGVRPPQGSMKLLEDKIKSHAHNREQFWSRIDHRTVGFLDRREPGERGIESRFSIELNEELYNILKNGANNYHWLNCSNNSKFSTVVCFAELSDPLSPSESIKQQSSGLSVRLRQRMFGTSNNKIFDNLKSYMLIVAWHLKEGAIINSGDPMFTHNFFQDPASMWLTAELIVLLPRDVTHRVYESLVNHQEKENRFNPLPKKAEVQRIRNATSAGNQSMPDHVIRQPDQAPNQA